MNTYSCLEWCDDIHMFRVSLCSRHLPAITILNARKMKKKSYLLNQDWQRHMNSATRKITGMIIMALLLLIKNNANVFNFIVLRLVKLIA